MQTTDVNCSSPVFMDHPPDWQAPSDLVAGFTLAWALEVKEREKLSPVAPFAPGVANQLPVQYRFDTLGRLVQLSPATSAIGFGRSPIVRLTALCGAWQLFEILSQSWSIRPGDFNQFANLLSFVTGGTERPSLYQDLSANLGKCLLAVRLRRAFHQVAELDPAEEWFVSGDSALTFRDARGNDSLLFQFGGINRVPLGLFAHDFYATVWSTARVTVDQLGPDTVIAMHKNRVEPLSDLLRRGGEKALRAKQELSPLEFGSFDNWPGWA
jgi:hypothetical protein